MKKLIYMLCCLFALGCGKSGPDCLQVSGETETYRLDLPSFDRVTVFERISLQVKQGAAQEVRLQTTTNLRNDISAVVEEGRLILRNENTCNLFRPYGETTVVITVPDLKEIRSSSSYPVYSEGVLSFDRLTLLSESFNVPEAETTDGSFHLNLDTNSLRVICNGIAYLDLRGRTDTAEFIIAAGDSRIEADELQAERVILDHRGSNDMLVNPLDAIEGVIRGTGDVRSFNRPEVVEVQTIYKGQLIFEP